MCIHLRSKTIRSGVFFFIEKKLLFFRENADWRRNKKWKSFLSRFSAKSGNEEPSATVPGADLALGIAKLMKIRKTEDLSSLACFICQKKCKSTTKFLSHFQSHIKDSSDEESELNEGRKRLKRKRKKPARMAADLDGDSGCHSVESRSESSSYSQESSCPGDSESSSCESETSKFSKSVVTLKDRLSLAEKQLDNNETEGLICLTCLKRFSNCQNLRRHLRLHISRDSITPDIDRSCEDVDDVESGRYFCDWCPARFDNRSAARIHESTHKGQETKCYICDKTYADRYSLRYHLRTHGIGRQIRCEYCNKSFSKPSRLEAHIRSHHNNIRDFKCSECGKAFKTRSHLENHFRQHSGERPYECTVCGDNFRHKISLMAHQRSHEGLKPYCCEVCGKTFREPSTLKAHSRVHTGDKPYKCQLCDKAFTQRAGLNYHRQSHSGEKPHKCQICHFATGKNASLVCHYKNVHKLKEPPIKNQPQAAQQPLPSPPVQSGDALMSGKDSRLPSFDHLKTPGSSSPSPFPLPSLSPAASTTSSDCSSTFTNGKGCSEREVTPPLTPPPVHNSNGMAMDDYNMINEQMDFYPNQPSTEIQQQQPYGDGFNQYGAMNYQSCSYHQSNRYQDGMMSGNNQWFNYGSNQDIQYGSTFSGSGGFSTCSSRNYFPSPHHDSTTTSGSYGQGFPMCSGFSGMQGYSNGDNSNQNNQNSGNLYQQSDYNCVWETSKVPLKKIQLWLKIHR